MADKLAPWDKGGTFIRALGIGWRPGMRPRPLKRQKPKSVNLLTAAYPAQLPFKRLFAFALLFGMFAVLPGYIAWERIEQIQEKSAKLATLKATVAEAAGSSAQIAELAALQGAVEENEQRLRNWPHNTYAWSETLFILEQELTGTGYLQEIRQKETYVHLKGYTPTYSELAVLLQDLEDLKLFVRLELIDSQWDTKQEGVRFELRGSYADPKAGAVEGMKKE